MNPSACGTLSSIANNDANQVPIAAAGGITAIVAAMQAHPNDAVLNKSACGALWTIAVNTNNQVTIAVEGGITCMVQAIVNHPSVFMEIISVFREPQNYSVNITENCCRALVAVAGFDVALQEAVKKAGGVAFAEEATVRHPDSADVEKYAKLLVAKLQ